MLVTFVATVVRDVYLYTLKKINFVEWHHHGGKKKNMHVTFSRFGTNRKKIRRLDKKYKILLRHNFGKTKLRQKLSNKGPVFSEEVDDAL